MTDGRRPGSLRRRIALWMSLSAAVSLTVFAVTSYLLVTWEEQEDVTRGTPDEGAAEIRTEAAEEVLIAMAVAAPLALVLSVAGSVWISRRTLAPLYEVVRTADRMSAQHLSHRLEVTASDRELASLVEALNRLFDRLETGFGALERYAADASHELRTPLAVIGSELEVALRHPRTSDEWRRVATTALDELRRLTRLVEALLELSRMSASAEPAFERFDLAETVEHAVAALQPQARAAGISLTVSGGRDAPVWVRGVADAVEGAVASLVANALRYTPRGGSVEVSVGERPETGGGHVIVDDSGPGVPEAEREAIFAPFERGSAGRADEAATEGSSRGLGLGLALVRRVAELHGGRCVVEAGPLGGARFVLFV